MNKLTIPDFLRRDTSGHHQYAIGQRVRKAGGSFQHSGTVVAAFTTTTGAPRVVLEFDEPIKGMLHIYLSSAKECSRYNRHLGWFSGR